MQMNFYRAYCYFFEKSYAAKPLKRTQLVAKINLLGNHPYKRPHVSRNQTNKYAFCGMKLKDDWQSLIDANANKPYSFEKAAFINELFDIVNQLPAFPDDKFSWQPSIEIITGESD